MKPIALIFGIWFVLSIEPWSLMATSTEEGLHQLNMTILCDNFKMNGDIDLEFKNCKPYSIWDFETHIPIFFRNLHIETESILVGGVLFDNISGEIRIDALEPTTQLYIYRESNVPAREIFISGIKAGQEDAGLSFSAVSGESYVSIGEGSIVYLENKYSNPEWVLKIEGRFQVIGSIYSTVMEDKEIRFLGSLQIENPKLSDSNELMLGFSFFYDISVLQLENGFVVFSSEYDLLPNRFIEVVDDNFKIDTEKGFYITDEFLREFNIRYIHEMEIYGIRATENRLSVESYINYNGETIFPKIEVITRYFFVNEDNTTGDLLLEVSNLGTNDKRVIEFLVGRAYMVEIYAEKLVDDDIVVDVVHKDLTGFWTEKDLLLGFPYKYKFVCIPSFSEKQPSECYTEFFYYKRNEERSFIIGKTESFFAEIKSQIEFEIEDIMGKMPYEIGEDENVSISKRITLLSEISVPIDVLIFPIVEGFRVEKRAYYHARFSKKGDYIDVGFELRAPFIRAEIETFQIRIFVMYRIYEWTEYRTYLPDYAEEATIVETITVRKEFLTDIIEVIFILFIAMICATIILQSLYIIRTRKKRIYGRGVLKGRKDAVEEELTIKDIILGKKEGGG